MALAPPKQSYPTGSTAFATAPGPARSSSPRPNLSLQIAVIPGAQAEAGVSSPFQIPAFLQDILAAHPAPSTPASANVSTNPYTSSAALYTLPQAPPPPEDPLIPPENFSVVASGVYRSGFPKRRNFKFMETLRLKTVLTLVLEDYPDTNLKWCEERDVQFMTDGKEPFDNIPEDVICSALVAILDKRNHPILIHCNKGKHRTGCLIGCIRRLQSWSLTSIFDEYRRFSIPKSRAVDQQFIDLFDLSMVWDEVLTTGGGIENLPQWGMLNIPRRAEITAAQRNGRRASLAGL